MKESGTKVARSQLLEAVEEYAESKASVCLQIFSSGIAWFIFLHQGKLIYASHSIDPFERLERQLRRLNFGNSQKSSGIISQLRFNFEAETPADLPSGLDYRAIYWLVKQNCIELADARSLVKLITLEVMESFLLMQSEASMSPKELRQIPIFYQVKLQTFIQLCRENIRKWQTFSPLIWSPYQRLYFFNIAQGSQKLSPQQKQKLGKYLRGFNFRQLGALLNQDELALAQKLFPLIKSKVIVLRDPQPPFNQLPKIPCPSLAPNPESLSRSGFEQTDDAIDRISVPPTTAQDKYKIVCVDDSPTVLREIQTFLKDQNVSVFTIANPVKALMEIVRIKPDLILLDVGMPTIDGYQMCRTLRKHSALKTKPIVMVTSHTGLIDRARARLSGATDYLTKPFTQPELLKMVFRYLV